MLGRHHSARSIARFAALACSACIALLSASARADVPSQVYDDARAIVQELVSDEAAHNVVPLAMCVAPDINQYFPRSLERIYHQQFGGLRDTVQEETSFAIAYVIYREITRDASQPAAAIVGQREALLNVQLSIQAPDPEASDDGYQKLQPPAANAATQPGIEASASPATQATLEECKKAAQKQLDTGAYPSGETIRDLFEKACLDPTTDAQTAYACSIARAAQSLLSEEVELAREHLLQAISAVFAAALVQPSGSFAETYEVVARALTTHLDGGLVDFGQVLVELKVDPVVAVEMKAKLERAIAQWRLVVRRDGKTLDFAAFLRTLNGSQGVLTALCVPEPFKATPLCTAVGRARTQVAAGAKIWKVVRTISNKQYRDAAIAVLRDIFPISDKCSTDEFASEDACALRKELRVFSENLVSYVADLSDDGDVTAATSVAFRSSAVDLIRSLGVGGGIDRTFGSRFVAPQFTLGYSWSSGFIEQVGSDGTRLAVSLDWLNLRPLYRRTPLVYFDVRLWFIDALGPFGELAMRKTGSYERSEAAWLAFLHPKVAFNLASPALSTHLIATLSIGLRPIAAFADEDGNLGYTLLWNDKTETSDYWARFLDFGLAVGYLL